MISYDILLFMGIKETANNCIWRLEPIFQKGLIPPFLKTTTWLTEHKILSRVEGAENLKLINNPSASVVFASNHNAGLKDLVVIEACYTEMAKLGEEYIGHWSLPHAKSYEDNIMPYSAWVRVLRKKGYTMTGVVHGYQGRHTSSTKEESESQKSSIQAFRDILKPYARMFVFVEGHRSHNLQLAVNPAEDIIGFLMLLARKRKQPLFVVPTATIPKGLGSGIYFGKPRDIAFLEQRASEFIEKHQLSNDQDTMITLLSQVAMLDLCEQLLPPPMHGMYDQSNPYFLEVMTGQIKLGVVREGNKELVKPVRKSFDSQGNTIWQPLAANSV